MQIGMNSRRNHYSSTPLMRMDKHKMPEPQSYYEPPVIEDETIDRPRKNGLLQLCLLFVLPVFMIVAFILNRPLVYAVFIGASLLMLVIMWLTKTFTQNARGKLTLFYAVATLAVVALIIIKNPGNITKLTVSRVDSNAIFSQNNVLDTPSLTDIQARAEEQAQAQAQAQNQNSEPTEEPQATDIPISAAQYRLEEFMTAWAMDDQEKMLAMCSPTWIDNQENPGASLFNLRALATPTSYIVEQVYGTNTDNSRPIMIIANFNNTNGTSTSRRYQIMMVRSNDTWYVDPDSLNSIGVITEESESFEQHSALLANMTPSPTPAPTVNPAMQLYYNAAGRGSYYHVDPNCSSMSPEWLPLTASFPYASLDDPSYRTLKPCKKCHAPERLKNVY